MLDTTFPSPPSNGGYDLRLKADSGYKDASKRVLIILQTVPSEDLKERELCSKPYLSKALAYAKKWARLYGDIGSPAFAVINYQARKHLDLSGSARSDAESEFKARAQKLIAKLNPTHILFSGDLELLYPQIKHAAFKNGWVHSLDGRKVTSTLDFARLLEKDGANANLLGLWCRNLANLLLGRNPHDIGQIELRPRYVNTIAKFKKLLRYWDEADSIAVDTETRNLSVLHNAIYTIQFAFAKNDGPLPTSGYVLPIDHPHEDNPFSEKERRYIKRELAKKFASRETKLLLTFNGIFDLRIIRRALGVPIIRHRVWEIMAGEHDLDENVNGLAPLLGKGINGLMGVLASYGCDFYLSEDRTFGKEDRSTTGSVSPSDKGFLEYGSMDACALHHIRYQQIRRAAKQDLNGKPYTKYFIRHMLYQMSDTVHQLSHLKDAGSKVDRRYLKSLMNSDSPLVKTLAELGEEFKQFPEVRKANKELLGDTGFKAKSIFGSIGGKVSESWTFSFNKAAHKIKLFVDIMGLTPRKKTATGAPAIDASFIDHYKDRNFLVAKFGEYQKSSKLLSTYVKGWYKKLRDLDGATDSHLRADYGFFGVDSGRLGSFDPNLQNIPNRGKLAKIIKEMFVTEDGHLLIRFDYSSHEIRGWSIVAFDKALASVFRVGQKLRQEWIKIIGLDKALNDLHVAGLISSTKLPLSPEDKAKLEAYVKGKQ